MAWDYERNESNGFEPIPEGKYRIRIKEAEKAVSKSGNDMLVLKFIQGLPVVGIVGGLSNPVYFNKIMEYVRLKYHKRYLLNKKEEME